MNIVSAIILSLIVNGIIAATISFLIKAIIKRKISKGWCIFVFVLSVFTTFTLLLLLTGKFYRMGFFDYAIHLIIVFSILYDKELPSFLDSEKEQIRKYHLRHKIEEAEEKEENSN